MIAPYRETPCRHCGELGQASTPCPDCECMVCSVCLGPEQCPTPVPRVHQLGVGQRVLALERTGSTALYATTRGVLQTYNLAREERVLFPNASSTAHEGLATGDRLPRAALLERGALLASVQTRRDYMDMCLQRRGEVMRALPLGAAPSPSYADTPRLFVSQDESMLFTAFHDRRGRRRVDCFVLGDEPHLRSTLSLHEQLRHAVLLEDDLAALATADDITLYELNEGRPVSRIGSDLYWLCTFEKQILMITRQEVNRATLGRNHTLIPDRQWKVSLDEPTMTHAPSDASLALDGSVLALLGKTRSEVLLLDMLQQRVMGLLQFTVHVDLMRFVEGSRLFVALANGQIIEHWQRSLLTTR
ncbi:MAG: hypothetical protein JRH20_02895 [Deltaproteobacteria bacterium]|nr:hypothetical protein [Deltaproteobacteria bacterium]